MKAVRAGLVLSGAALVGYGGWLLWPQLPAAWTWLLAGPILHDVVVAPAVGIAGLALGRLIPDPARRAWVAAGLAISAVLILVGVPLLWRPQPAPINPGLHDRDYVRGLIVAVLAIWAGIFVSKVSRRLRHAGRPPGSTAPPTAPEA
ncbi:hypothetical protein [Micromonospora sp. CPCC 206061]|uniref:hypothetical protein n=1 Tax=Micromonospora sp. CPCC 206061 TaxID=3122410 RepID=UPI002FEEC9D1